MATAVVGGEYRHFKKHNSRYRVLYLAVDSTTYKPVVVYQGVESGNVWTRNRDEFEGNHPSGPERFVRIE